MINFCMMYADLRRLQYNYFFKKNICNTYVLSSLIESIKEQAKTGNLRGLFPPSVPHAGSPSWFGYQLGLGFTCVVFSLFLILKISHCKVIVEEKEEVQFYLKLVFNSSGEFNLMNED